MSQKVTTTGLAGMLEMRLGVPCFGSVVYAGKTAMVKKKWDLFI